MQTELALGPPQKSGRISCMMGDSTHTSSECALGIYALEAPLTRPAPHCSAHTGLWSPCHELQIRSVDAPRGFHKGGFGLACVCCCLDTLTRRGWVGGDRDYKERERTPMVCLRADDRGVCPTVPFNLPFLWVIPHGQYYLIFSKKKLIPPLPFPHGNNPH